MTFVGKVLVVVQLVLSLLFMAFAGAVFTVQSNWKAEYEKSVVESEGLTKRVEADRAVFDKLKDDVKKVIFGDKANVTEIDDLIKGEHPALTETGGRSVMEFLAIVKAERDSRTLELATAVKDVEGKAKSLERVEANARILTDEVNARRGEADKSRVVITELHKKQDVLVSSLKIKDDQLLAQERQISQLDLLVKGAQESLLDLQETNTKLMAVIEKENIDPEEVLASSDVLPPAPEVGGLVLASRKVKQSQFVEISIGSDDGLVKGHKLYVFRTAENNGGRPKYLGRIQLMLVTPDRAVGTVVEPAKNGIITREDHVTTKL